jgi:hypothetical protein
MTTPDTYTYIKHTLGYRVVIRAMSESRLRWLVTLQFLGTDGGRDIAYLQFEKARDKALITKLARNAVRDYLKTLAGDLKAAKFEGSTRFHD